MRSHGARSVQNPMRVLVLLASVLVAALGCGGDEAARILGAIDASGGAASDPAGRGGSGGQIFALIREPAASDIGIEVRRKGRVDTSFASPSLPAADTGSNGFVVDREIIVSSVAFTDPTAGSLYMIKQDESLYESDGDTQIGDEEPITGIVVRRGGRLVLPHHFLHELDRVTVVFSDDIVNDGEITSSDLTTRDRGSFDLVSEAGGYRGSGDLLAQGLRPGQAGGQIGVRILADGFNDGDWLAFGGGDGAAGGGVSLDSSARGQAPLSSFENTGRIIVHGGDHEGAFGVGGDGGIVIFGLGGHMLHSGTIDASGGAGDAAGGEGGVVIMGTGRTGDFVNVGEVIADGGPARSGLGGRGGELSLIATGGSLRSTGDVLARGGRCPEGEGGAGGEISLTSRVELGAPRPDDLGLAGPIHASGRIVAAGGDGRITGGEGGLVGFSVETSSFVQNEAQHIALLGQRRVSVAGGDGRSGGGSGGEVTFDSASVSDDPLSPVAVEVPVDASGGDAGLDAPNLDGGNGGFVTFRGITIERGDVDVSAGEGTLAASDGEVFEIFP